MEELPILKISVRSLVEFLLQSGDIDNRVNASQRAEAMQEGSRMHRKIQRRMGASYQAEVPLKTEQNMGRYRLLIEGRADGIWLWEEKPAVDEIKCVYRDVKQLLEPVPVHKAQAMCYAYMYADDQRLDEIVVQMTYCNLDTEEIRRFQEAFSFSKLKDWFLDLTEQYRRWSDFQFAWNQTRTESIAQLAFPYAWRNGQKELAKDVYRTILRKKNLFLQAPTGTGKTLSVLYPAVRAMGESLADKIFYLTAKTVTQTVAKEAFALFYEKGVRMKVAQITAKEKMCLCEEMDCNPVHCPYAKGHYDRVGDAVFALLSKEDFFTRETVLSHARDFEVCPFELCLDAAVWSDALICDYNYAFDPNACLKRFFAEGQKGDYVFLVDEAHNLVERARSMYSAGICKEDLLAVRRMVKDRDEALGQEFSRCNRLLLDYKRSCDTYRVCQEEASGLLFALLRLAEKLDVFLQAHPAFPERKEVTECYLNLRQFISVYEKMDERYVAYMEHDEAERFCIRLLCADPSGRLQQYLDKGRATVFFSATMLPIQYYKEMLSLKTDNYAVYAQSSFTEEQKLLLIGRDVSSRYKRRNEAEFEKIAYYIAQIASAKKGNYMAFFPSYRLMEQVYERFLAMAPQDMRMLKQESGMREADREAFLEAFAEKDTAVTAFCVMGGIFGEGIDLTEEKLIGAIIVGTGLPQTGNEREILKAYYEEKEGAGFEYAYRYPGMNKVLQAAGRVIRTTKDRGIIALLDERFLDSSYRSLFPREWETYQVCSRDTVLQAALRFWEQI